MNQEWQQIKQYIGMSRPPVNATHAEEQEFLRLVAVVEHHVSEHNSGDDETSHAAPDDESDVHDPPA